MKNIKKKSYRGSVVHTWSLAPHKRDGNPKHDPDDHQPLMGKGEESNTNNEFELNKTLGHRSPNVFIQEAGLTLLGLHHGLAFLCCSKHLYGKWIGPAKVGWVRHVTATQRLFPPHFCKV